MDTPPEAAAWSARQRAAHKRIAFVPTMGALHEGHLQLVRAARKSADAVAASVYVNPLQFNNPEDLAHYPRQPLRDRDMLEQAGADMVLMPRGDSLFAQFSPRRYDIGSLEQMLEGSSRPGHFQGVANVVERLFHYVRPDEAWFGEKDRQQLAVIRQVAAAERWPVAILSHPTVRASDGLALSSRNERLSADERRQALVLYRALAAMREVAFRASPADTLRKGHRVLEDEPQVQLDYLVVAHPLTLEPLRDWGQLNEAVALVAAQVGPVRLIDNMAFNR